MQVHQRSSSSRSSSRTCSRSSRAPAAPFRALAPSSAGTCAQRRSSTAASAAQQEQHAASSSPSSAPTTVLSRRAALQLALLCASGVAGSAAAPQPALAFSAPPPGYRLHTDKLDGYSFVYPENWSPVTSSGNDIFLRNTAVVEENLFVDMSSPSSSRFLTVEDLGTPQEAAEKKLEQYLTREFMSTRLGIRREGEILSATARDGPNDRKYYDIVIRMKSYGSRNPYVATQTEVLRDYGLEWDRVLVTTLAVANKRLYELRLQTPVGSYQRDGSNISQIVQSFTVREVEA